MPSTPFRADDSFRPSPPRRPSRRSCPSGRAQPGRCCATPASARPARRSPTSCRSPSTRRSSWSRSPTSTSAASSRCSSAFPKVRVYQDWRELLKKEHAQHRLGERLDPRSHALPGRDGGDEARQAGLRAEAALQHAARNAPADRGRAPTKADDADGHPGVVERTQRYGEALVRSGIVGKIREVHTFSNKSWGDDKPLPEAHRSGAGAARLGRVARRVSAPRPFKKGVYHPGEWRRRVGFGTGHARRHGLPHLQPALSRAEADVADRGHRRTVPRRRPRAGRRRRA